MQTLFSSLSELHIQRFRLINAGCGAYSASKDGLMGKIETNLFDIRKPLPIACLLGAVLSLLGVELSRVSMMHPFSGWSSALSGWHRMRYRSIALIKKFIAEAPTARSASVFSGKSANWSADTPVCDEITKVNRAAWFLCGSKERLVI